MKNLSTDANRLCLRFMREWITGDKASKARHSRVMKAFDVLETELIAAEAEGRLPERTARP